MNLTAGFASLEGTARYSGAHAAAKGHYRQSQGLTFSSVGMGSYLGETDSAARAAYADATLVALQSGINVLDTAANYRDQASERDLGAGIARFLAAGGRRDEIVVASKAGFIHGDCDEPDGDAWFDATFLDPSAPVLLPGDVVSGHSLAPRFIERQLDRSRANLGLACLDIYYLHNPEHQLEWGISESAFYDRIEAAFEALERAVDAGKLRMYGVATWDGLRAGPEEKGHLSLVKLVHHAGAARMKAGGKASEHHFRAIQLPVNLVMTEAFLRPGQPFRFGAQTILAAAKELGMVVMSSASLMQMRIAGRIPPEYAMALGTRGDAATALQFTRSVPGVTTALVGMGRPEHATANAAFATSHAPDSGTVKTLLGTGSIHGA
ncbi:MAG: aldo/keto reductase [Candidatus Thermoplasmatota archaeon]